MEIRARTKPSTTASESGTGSRVWRTFGQPNPVFQRPIRTAVLPHSNMALKLPGGSAQSTLYSVPLEQNLLASKELTPRPPRAGPWKVRKCEPSLRHRGNEGAERRGKQIQLKGPRSIVGCVPFEILPDEPWWNFGGTLLQN